MIRVDLDVATLARVYWRCSPLAELIGWLARSPHERNFPGPARTLFADPAIGVLAHLLPLGHLGSMPDFLTPAPSSLSTKKAFCVQLDQLASSPPELVYNQVSHHFKKRAIPSELAGRLDAGTFAACVSSAIRRIWRDEFSTKFDDLRTGLEDDLSYRSNLLASDGIGRAFESLNPRFAWDPRGGIQYITNTWDEDILLKDTELVIIPSLLFYGSNVTFPVGAAPQYPITYPAMPRLRRSGAAGEMKPKPLIGSSRFHILNAVRTPCTTTTLSADLHLSAATVSYHLGVLHRSGLVNRIPQGRQVLYSITLVGRAFLASGGEITK